MRARLLRFQLRSGCLYDEFQECRSDELDSLRTRELMITCYNLIFNQIQKVAEISKGVIRIMLYKQKMIRIPLLAVQVNHLYQGYERGINLCIYAINVEIRGAYVNWQLVVFILYSSRQKSNFLESRHTNRKVIRMSHMSCDMVPTSLPINTFVSPKRHKAFPSTHIYRASSVPPWMPM